MDQTLKTLDPAIQLLITMAIFSLLPFVFVCMTSFLRFTIVFSILKTALGTQQVPPGVVIIGLSMIGLSRKNVIGIGGAIIAILGVSFGVIITLLSSAGLISSILLFFRKTRIIGSIISIILGILVFIIPLGIVLSPFLIIAGIYSFVNDIK